jgi:hypothetical protein
VNSVRRASADDADDVVFAHVEVVGAFKLEFLARVLAEEDLVAGLTPMASRRPLSSVLPGPTATTSPIEGFSAAVSGMTIRPRIYALPRAA